METKVRQLVKEAMIEKNKDKQLTYKSILENAQKIAKNDGNRKLTDSDFVKATKNEIKSLKDLLEYCEKESSRYFEITKKIDYCLALLPKMATPNEIKSFLTGENIEKNIGVCMKTLKIHFGDTLDGKMAQEIVKEYITQ